MTDLLRAANDQWILYQAAGAPAGAEEILVERYLTAVLQDRLPEVAVARKHVSTIREGEAGALALHYRIPPGERAPPAPPPSPLTPPPSSPPLSPPCLLYTSPSPRDS